MSFIEIFAPGMRHLREERERQRHDVAYPKQGGPPFGIDLDAGTARFTVPAAPPETEHLADPEDADETPPVRPDAPD
jgi:hypothetical protein